MSPRLVVAIAPGWARGDATARTLIATAAEGGTAPLRPKGEWCSSFGVCIQKSSFPVEHKNLPRGETCYLDRECASGQCPTNGTSTFGSVGNCR